MVKINGTLIEFNDGMTLAELLAKAGVDRESCSLITVDGKLVDKNNIGQFLPSDGAEIRVLHLLSGG